MTSGSEGDRPTELIRRARDGDARAVDRLFQQLYDELREIAERQPYARHGQTYQPTVLVNELWLAFSNKFPEFREGDVADRRAFLDIAATAMRRLLCAAYRRKRTRKRGGDHRIVAMGEIQPGAGAIDFDQLDYLAVDDALTELEDYNPRWYDVVKFRFLLGRTIEETAELLSIATSTVTEDWKKSQAWLRSRLAP